MKRTLPDFKYHKLIAKRANVLRAIERKKEALELLRYE
jgi:hypothetical protein